jgi:hypothetical protein
MRANVGALLLMIRAFPDGVADDEAVAARARHEKFMGWVRYLSSLVEDLCQEVLTPRPVVAPSVPVALAPPAGVAGAVADDEEVGGRRLSISLLYLLRPLQLTIYVSSSLACCVAFLFSFSLSVLV